MSAAWARWSCTLILVLWGAAAVHYATLRLPPGVHLSTAAQALETRDVTFMDDITGADAYGHGFSSHGVFDTMLGMIGDARSVLVLDCHLCSDMHRTAPDAVATLTPMAAQLFAALQARKLAVPQLRVLVIADPVNGLYGSAPSAQFAALRAAGIQIVTANLSVLRDRNFLYAGPWRLLLGWWSPPDAGGGWLPNPFSDSGPPFTARAWAQLANLKSSDRRVLIADDGHGTLTGLVGTAEPAMASSIDSVTALKVRGPVLETLLASELQLAAAFGWRGTLAAPDATPATNAANAGADTVTLQWLGEGAIRQELLRRIAATAAGASIDIASDNLSERAIISALIAASRRGVGVRMILDPQKNRSLWGSANQTVGSELIASSDGRIHVAWYRTHSEQFRAALVLIHGGGSTWMLTGSASLTRRDLGDYDLSLDAALAMPSNAAPASRAQEFFDTLWNDRAPPGIEFTADTDAWADPSQLRYWTHRLMESLGVSPT